MSAGRSPTIAVSTWSLHRTVGLTWWDKPGEPATEKEAYGKGSVKVLDLPAAVKKHGIPNLQLGHFHVPKRDKAWLREFRAAAKDAGVTITSLLVDDGDPSNAATHKRDVAWINQWVDLAAEVGAKTARVVAGKQKPSADTLALSVAGLKDIAAHGKSVGVRVITENWHDLLSSPKEVHHVLDAVGDDLGILVDFGNWKGAGKYADLASIMPRGEDTHAKCSFSAKLNEPDAMDRNDYGKCVLIAADAGYDGPYTLIYDGPDDDEWAGLAMEAQFIRDTLASASRKIA
ncbi:MAG TPA: TIM barrel protein [Bauldia sp.]|nr:TIM barrel protein [Bauldia sp.]